MEANTASSSSDLSSSEPLLRALISRGWCFRDTERIRGLIAAHLLSAHGSTLGTVHSIESELLNMDLRSLGGKCLPQPSVLAKTPHLQGPLVLQVSSSRDISRSCIADSSGISGKQRLLRLKLTDGHSEITAIEYFHVPSIPEDVVPGTKVQLQNKVNICSGILCLNSKAIIILGGVVQSLYEEWQIKRKYLDLSSYSSRPTHDNALICPPPFEKLQIRKSTRGTASVQYTSATTGFPGSSSNESGQSLGRKGESSNLVQTVKFQSNNAAMGSTITDEIKPLDNVGENKEKLARDLIRPKVDASIPVQNQEAAQKLLQKQSQPNYNNNRNFRGQRHRGKEKEEESNFLTLEEWERKRTTGLNMPTPHVHSGVNQDEDLARQMQQQFDLEDIHVQRDSHGTDAKDITMSMFNFERDNANAYGSGDFRGRGRGRGRRGRGRGRGRF